MGKRYDSWKQLRYWQKGAIIGFLFPIAIFLISLLLNIIIIPFMYTLNKEIVLLIQDICMSPLFLFSFLLDLSFKYNLLPCNSEACAYGGPQLLIAVFSPILYAIVGALIGLLIDKVHRK